MWRTILWQRWMGRTRGQRRRQRTEARTRLSLESLEDRTLLTAWTALGPAPVNISSDFHFAGNTNSGRITGIAADPHDANTVYIAAAGGGIWKTTDAGHANPTWTPLTDNIAGTTDSMGALAIAPSNANVLYAGTGEANNSQDSNYGEGILVSTNGGTSWTLENPGGIFTRLTVSKIVVDPDNADVAYAAVGNNGVNGNFFGTGIYKTLDGGATWTNTTSSITTSDAFSDIVLNPNTPTTLYAAVGRASGDAANGIYESTDSGGSWSLLANFPNGASDGRIALAISPSAPSVIYAAAADPTTGGLAAMETSTDGGSTWNKLANTPNFLGDQGYYDVAIAVDPTNSSIVYIGGENTAVNGGNFGAVYESTNAGQSWTSLAQDDNSEGTHPDLHALVFDANNHLLVGSDGGTYRKDSDPHNANGFLWTDLNGDLNTIQFYNVAINPSNSDVLGGSQDNGVDLYTPNNGTWTNTPTGGGDGGQVFFASSTLAYHGFSISDVFSVSTDGGQSWTHETTGLNLSDPMNGYPPFAVDPGNPAVVILGSNQIYLTTNTASLWSILTVNGVNGWNNKTNNNSSGNLVDTIGVSADSNPLTMTIYAATGGKFATSSQIFVSSDGGLTWTEQDLPAGSGRVNQILVDPTNAQTAYAVVSSFTSGAGHVWETTNGGQTWTDISGNLPNLPTWSIQLDGVHNVLYVGNDSGVFVSTNGGQSWSQFGTGFPTAQVFNLAYDPTLSVLVAGTHGRGAWEISTAVPVVVTTNPSNQTVKAGQTATFTAAASGDPTPTAQWQVSTDGGKSFGNISGATSTTLTLNNVTAAMNGNEYQAVFTNSAGNVTTTAATLTVHSAPLITGNPNSQSVTVGSNVSFTAAASGNPTPTVQWQVSTDGGKTFGNISGATNTTLTLSNVALAVNGDEYEAVFTNSVGSATTSAATLTVTATAIAPSITGNPSSQSVMAGQSATFTASAGGSPTPTVQWQVSTDGGTTFANIIGATSAILTVSNVAASMNGEEYQAVFTNSAGSATTTAATLTVSVSPPPAPPPPVAPPPPPAPPAPPTLNVPPLLALFNQLLGGSETVNADRSVTVTDTIFGIPLLVSTFNSSGNLESVLLFGIEVTALFESAAI